MKPREKRERYKSDIIVLATAILVLLGLIFLMVHTTVVSSSRNENIRASEPCGEQQILSMTRPKGSDITFVMCEDSTIVGR